MAPSRSTQCGHIDKTRPAPASRIGRESMRMQRTGVCLSAIIVLVLAMPALALADELTQRIQKDLVALGYDPGSTSGEVSTDTTIAIAKFQAQRGVGRLMSAVSRSAGRAGNYDLHRTADGLSAAARDLGLTEDEVAACQNPE